jgi:hypothetical protein
MESSRKLSGLHGNSGCQIEHTSVLLHHLPVFYLTTLPIPALP